MPQPPESAEPTTIEASTTEATTAGEPLVSTSPSRRSVVIVVGSLTLAAVALLSVLVLALRDDAGHRHVVDEGAWRAAREAQGTTFADWAKYVDVWVNDVCPDEDIDMFLAISMDGGSTIEELRTDISYACPNRLPDIDEYVRWLADPCAGYDAEERSRFEEASGTTC